MPKHDFRVDEHDIPPPGNNGGGCFHVKAPGQNWTIFPVNDIMRTLNEPEPKAKGEFSETYTWTLNEAEPNLVTMVQ